VASDLVFAVTSNITVVYY